VNKNQLKAIQIAKQILQSIKPRVGIAEKELAQEIRKLLKKHGARSAFRILVGSGENAAIPHCYATNKKIMPGELVMVDFGANYKGYCSDVTRTFVMGKPNKKQKKLLSLVKAAQKKAIKQVKAGVKCSIIDKVARDHLKGHYFIHSTGHGVGKKVHQKPRISLASKERLKAGQVITIEPGIYIKGWGGVRIEDMVLVTKRGCKILT